MAEPTTEPPRGPVPTSDSPVPPSRPAFGGPDEAVAHLYDAWVAQDRARAALAAEPTAVEALFSLATAHFSGSGCTPQVDAHRCYMDGDGESLQFDVAAGGPGGHRVTSVGVVAHDVPPDPESDSDGGVLALQERLEGLGFWLGEPDGELGTLTTQAVLAFQKANGLTADGNAGPATLAALESAVRPLPHSTTDGIEIDLDRQLLFVNAGGEVRWVLHTSTGAPATPTRAGVFVVQRTVDGVRRAPLGPLYRPAYFDEGIAIHGSPSIPAYPASHGCARLSNPAMDMLWASNLVELGTPVRVV